MKMDYPCWLIIGNPFPYGGGEKHVYETLKHYNEFNISPILYVPFSDLIIHILYDEINRNDVTKRSLRDLEQFGVIVPSFIYDMIEQIYDYLPHYLEIFRKKGLAWAYSYMKNLIKYNKLDVTYAYSFLKNLLCGDRDIKNRIEIVYSGHEIASDLLVGSFLARSFSKELYVLLQLEPFTPLRKVLLDDWLYRVGFYKENIIRHLVRATLLILQVILRNTKSIYYRLIKEGTLRGLLSVSASPLVLSGLDSISSKMRIPVKIIKPSNAVSNELSKYSGYGERIKLLEKKEDFAVYFARLRAQKGLLEIPMIAKNLERYGYSTIVIGRFDNLAEKQAFFKKIKDLNVKSLKYMGWLPTQDLWDILSRAKVLVYPSHSDAFPLVVLEALFLGCSVVAYDIPAITSVYSSLKPVKIVHEYDIKAMSEEVIRVLKKATHEHIEEHTDDNLMKFLEIHSSWRNVAGAEINAIREIRGHQH